MFKVKANSIIHLQGNKKTSALLQDRRITTPIGDASAALLFPQQELHPTYTVDLEHP